MPILSCLEAIRFKMMKRITVNFIKVASRDSESLCPQAYETIKERKKLACMCYPTFNGNGMFEVREGLRSWVVDVRASQCACGLWQLSGLPCEHVLACITYNRDPIEPYCDPCYTIVNYRLAYEKRRLEARELATRKDKRGKSYKAVRRTGEKKKCSLCKKEGHNRRAHGSGGDLFDGNGTSSSNPRTNTSIQVTPPQHVPRGNETSSVRVTRSKMKVTRGGHTS
ncbi:hypothetical protein LINPERHAP1_LOCUS5853 [Linum perenne]